MIVVFVFVVFYICNFYDCFFVTTPVSFLLILLLMLLLFEWLVVVCRFLFVRVCCSLLFLVGVCRFRKNMFCSQNALVLGVVFCCMLLFVCCMLVLVC